MEEKDVRSVGRSALKKSRIDWSEMAINSAIWFIQGMLIGAGGVVAGRTLRLGESPSGNSAAVLPG